HAALAQAANVSGLVLLEPVFFRVLDLAGDAQTLEAGTRFFTAYANKVMGGNAGAASEMNDYWVGPGAFSRMPAPVNGLLEGSPAKTAADVRAALAERVTAEQLAGFGKPALVVYGEASPPVAPAIAKALAQSLPAARLHGIPGANHGMLDGHPGAVADLIRQ